MMSVNLRSQCDDRMQTMQTKINFEFLAISFSSSFMGNTSFTNFPRARYTKFFDNEGKKLMDADYVSDTIYSEGVFKLN